MMPSENRTLLKEMHTRQRLEQIIAKKKYNRLNEHYKLTKVITNSRQLLFLEQRVKRLFERITPQELQNYLAWFQQVKKFVNANSELKTFKIATDKASADILTLLSGAKQGEAGFFKKIKSIFTGDETRGDDDRLNDINHFLWGITTVISSLPVMLQAVDQQMDGKLLESRWRKLLEAPKDDDFDFKSLGSGIEDPDLDVSKSAATSAADQGNSTAAADTKSADIAAQAAAKDKEDTYATTKTRQDKSMMSLRDFLESSLDGATAQKTVTTFKDLINRSMTQAVAQFGVGEIPYLKNSAGAIADDLLSMQINSIKDLGQNAMQLKSHWESEAAKFLPVAQKIDKSADNNKPLEITGKEDTADEDDTKIELASGSKVQLDDETIDKVSRAVKARLDRIKQKMNTGSPPSAAQVKAIAAIFKSLEAIK